MTTEATVEEQQQMVGEFLEGLAASFGIEATAENVAADDDSFEVNLAGDNAALGVLIGPQGNHLVALHEVTKTMLQRRLPGVARARLRGDLGVVPCDLLLQLGPGHGLRGDGSGELNPSQLHSGHLFVLQPTLDQVDVVLGQGVGPVLDLVGTGVLGQLHAAPCQVQLPSAGTQGVGGPVGLALGNVGRVEGGRGWVGESRRPWAGRAGVRPRRRRGSWTTSARRR